MGSFMTLLANYFSSVRNDMSFMGPYGSSVHTFALHNGESKISNTTLQFLDLSVFFEGGTGGSPIDYIKYFDDHKNVKFGTAPITNVTSAQLSYADLQMMKNSAEAYFLEKRVDLKDIYNGKKCYSEVLAYEIVKFKMVPTSWGLEKIHVQSIFLPSSDVGETISYMDTQVFYGQEYIYEIFTHSLVIGATYSYRRDISDWMKNLVIKPSEIVDDPAEPDGQIKLAGDPETYWPKYNQFTKAIIVRAPYYNTDSLLANNEELGEKEKKQITLLLDKPPLPPDISLYPYKDNANKILILLNINYGEKLMTPMPLTLEESDNLEKHKKAQIYEGLEKYIKKGYLLYKTELGDDTKGSFYIYRTTTKPTSWSGFDDAEPKIVKFMEQTGYEDFLQTNVDYYYFARFQDVHANFSNPTNIFYVRIVKEDGFPPYLITKVYDFNENKEPYKYDISFKKYIKINLADGVRKLTDDTANIQDASYGFSKVGISANDSQPSQLKKYKIRITSKQTGKKIDINLDFKKNIIENYLNKVKEDSVTLEEKALEDEIKKAEGKLDNPDDTPIC